MKKIETNADVLEWARAVVDAKGEKFTALSKGEQFVIANYIYENDKPVSGEVLEEPTSAPQPAAEPKHEDSPVSETPAEPVQQPPPQPPVTATMTRAYAYHRAGFDAQQVFDKFLEWVKEHPRANEVMDFSTGRKSPDAAFAYWLSEVITIDVPAQYSR